MIVKPFLKVICGESRTFSRILIKTNILGNKYYCENTSGHEKRSTSDIEKMLKVSSPLKRSVIEENIWATEPHPAGTIFYPEEPVKSLTTRIDPTHTSIILFPGQGSQYVGMGKNILHIPIVLDMFKAASEILQYDLLKLCLNGPKAKLSETKYCQAAIYVCSVAALEYLKELYPEAINTCVAAAGFSVGEIAAMVFAGCMNFEKGIKLVRIRAEAMDECAKLVKGGMMTVIIGHGADLSGAMKAAKNHCSELGIEDPECCVANYLFPECKVIAGNQEALDYVRNNARKYRLFKTQQLPVSGAFHTRLMMPAADIFKEALHSLELNEPLIKVYSNTSGYPYGSTISMVKNLPKQITRPVKWEQTLQNLFARGPHLSYPNTYTCGPGVSLKTILKRVNSKAAIDCRTVVC